MKNGNEVFVETLENISNGITPSAIPVSNTLDDADVIPMNKGEEPRSQLEPSDTEKTKRNRIAVLQEKSLSFRMGQTGASYEKLFAAYLEKANEITIEDPYIRAPWQIRNFVEFATMLVYTRPVDDLKLTLITNEEEEKLPDLIDRLDDIKDDLAGYGITFEYKFRDFHDRCIRTDTGWTITLGRGLDIFEKYNPYSVAASRQEKRKCKEFIIAYNKE